MQLACDRKALEEETAARAKLQLQLRGTKAQLAKSERLLERVQLVPNP